MEEDRTEDVGAEDMEEDGDDMSSEHTCGICASGYGGRVVPTILTCCWNDVCFDCAENDRNAKIAQLTGNKKRIKCMFCNRLFHSSNDTPWVVNKLFITSQRIEVDLTAVKEAQAAMHEAPPAHAPNNAAPSAQRDTRAMAQRIDAQDMNTEEGAGENNDAESDDESRFSTNPDDEEEELSNVEEEENQTSIEQPDSLAPVQQSCLISRKQLHYLTGGKQGGHKNPLNVATPMNHCGAPAFATKAGTVIHICVKEEINHPLPNNVNEEFLLYRTFKGGLARDIQLLMDHPNHPAIPVFWEPKDQEKTNVIYVGHWQKSDIEDYSENPITYLGIKRCALVKLGFVHFNQRWADIIHWCRDKSDAEIRSKNWDDNVAGEGNGSRCEDPSSKHCERSSSVISTRQSSKRRRND